ncbi:jhy protein homolog isoform 2-T2 [Acanthopagrus schlegelii]
MESNTENLAQEMAYQQQLPMSIDQNKYILPQKENADSLQHGDGKDEDATDEETEDLHVYDSLEVVAPPHTKWNPTMLQSEYMDAQIYEREGTSQLVSDDAYYDPNRRTNLKGAGCFNESPQVHETLKETAITEHQKDSTDPKLWWLRKTKQLRVTQIGKEKKVQWKEYPNPPQQQQPPAIGVSAEWRGSLSYPLARPIAGTQAKPQKMTSSQPLPHTVHLNINLSTSSHFLPLLQQRGQDTVINVASPHDAPQLSPTTEAEIALSHGKTALHCPLFFVGKDQKWSSNEVHSTLFPQSLPRTPTTTLSMCSGSYTVLPPIGKPITGKESELSPCQSVSTAYPIHRSNSDGYLVQMEKQKQLRAKVTYKAYSLKDYKQLKSDINLQGLGPDYKATEKTKMKRQRLYSIVIREQNRGMSRIPFLPAKDPEVNDKNVPRMRALEYAKTIEKPPVQFEPKQRQKHKSKGFTECTPFLEDLDMSQPVPLDVLRKRHEEEKKAVALFRKVHGV